MKHIEVVAAVIMKGDQILCVQKPEHKYDYISYKYEFPGGKIETGEKREEALRREIQEELHLPLSIVEEFITVNHAYPDFSLTMHSFICRADHYDFTLEEHIGFQWKTKDTLHELDWAAADVPIVEEIVKAGVNSTDRDSVSG